MLTFQSSWHNPLPGHWLLVLETTLQVHPGLGFDCSISAIPFLPRRALAAPCTNGISQLQATWSLTVMVLLFSIPRSGSYGEKTRDGRNKRSKELPTHISFNYILAAIPFLLLAARSGA